MKVPDAWTKLVEEESEKRLDQDDVNRVALADAEANGIVFLDEIDKIAVSDARGGGSVSREGVQRDLLPLIEGTTVATKYGPMKTDHVLFIASGAFHISKPSDMLPELQGRLPIRVELRALEHADFVRILSETRANLPTQYKALLATEEVTLEFTDDAIDAIARIAFDVNLEVSNNFTLPVHRLQDMAGRELLTVNMDEINFLCSIDYLDLGVAFYSAEIGNVVTNPIQRFFNPNNGDHLYSCVQAEMAGLPGKGWIDEGIAFNL
jgi:ATP-dependent HslUV protease ATP-binding subunit HslU